MERLCRYHQHLIMRILNGQHLFPKYLCGVCSRHKEIHLTSHGTGNGIEKTLSNTGDTILKVHLLNLSHILGASLKIPAVKQFHSDAGQLQHEICALNKFLHKNGSFNFRGCNFAAQLHSLHLALSRTFSTSSQNRNSGRADPDEENKDDKDEKDQDQRVPAPIMFLWLVCTIYLISRYMQSNSSDAMYKYISWNEFYHDMIAKGEVESVTVYPAMEIAIIRLHPGAIIKGNKVESLQYSLKIVDAYKFEEKVRRAEAELGIKPEDGVSVSYQRSSNWGPVVMLAVLGLGAFVLIRSLSKINIPSPMDMFANERKAKFVRVDILAQKGEGVSFKEVAGLKEAKIEIMEFVDYLKAPERFKELGARIPHGALLLGPPGCGKTLLAKAVATEAMVPFLAMAGSEFVEMVGGLGAARVRDLFKEARTHKPCIIYIDEIDAIGRKRSGSGVGSSGEEEQTLNQLLVEMDGMGTTEGVIVVAATNRADILDKALLRPGRFDRHITIDLPTLIERHEIFDMYLNQLKTEALSKNYSTKLAQMTPGMTGADINNICNEAAIHAASDNKKIVSLEDLDYAVERVIAGVAKKSALLSPEEKKIVAYHESGHALVGWLLKHTDALLRISIVPRTSSALGFAQYIPSDQKLYSKEELFERMCMALGGRAAEAIIFNHITTGAADDLKRVTDMAYNQIRSFGMNDRVGCLSFSQNPDSQSEDVLGAKPYSKSLSAVIDQEARLLISQAYQRTEQVLSNNKEKLQQMAVKLLEQETLTYDEIKAMIGPPPHGEKHKIEAVGWSWTDDNNSNNANNSNNSDRSPRQRRRRNREELGDE